MHLRFTSSPLADVCGSVQAIDQRWGASLGPSIRRRLALLVAVPTLDWLMEYPDVLPKKIRTDEQDRFSIPLRQDCHIVVVPDHKPIPRSANGDLLAKKVDRLLVLEVTHGS